jgi:hypothetical protein
MQRESFFGQTSLKHRLLRDAAGTRLLHVRNTTLDSIKDVLDGLEVALTVQADQLIKKTLSLVDLMQQRFDQRVALRLLCSDRRIRCHLGTGLQVVSRIAHVHPTIPIFTL